MRAAPVAWWWAKALNGRGYLRAVGHTGHDHDHAHEPHAHDAPHARGAGALRAAFFLNLGFTLVEAFGGWWTHSAAVWSDALHDTGDCLVLGLAWYLQRVAMKGRDARFSYGYGRFSMLGGWLTSAVLIVGAVVMSIACLQRILEPVAPHAPGMMLIAAFGLLMNGLAAWWLHGGDSLNERGAYLHLLEDVLGWAAVLIGAVLIQFTGWSVIDPLLGIGISLFIAWNAVRTLRQGTGILMQEVPAGVDERSVRAGLMTVPHVLGVHDQHTWTLDGRLIVHTVHLEVGTIGLAEARTVKAEARRMLGAMGIHHATIELEWAGEHCGLEHH